MNEPNPKLMDVIFLALDHGIESVKSSGGPLIPFVVTEGSERKLDVFVLEQLEEALAKAREFVDMANPEITFYAIAHDGYLTVNEVKSDAILVEGGERGNSKALLFAQRYEPKKGFFSKFKTFGNPAFIGETENRLK
jgi:hypothetical protein